jgi:flagellar biosynthesis chaperone FliJ
MVRPPNFGEERILLAQHVTACHHPKTVEQLRSILPACRWHEKTLQTLRRRQLTEVELAKPRGELIRKDLVEKQASFLLTAMRQRILQIPHTYARQLWESPT